MDDEAVMREALRCERAEAEVARLHGIFRAVDADALDRMAARLDREGLESGDTDHAIQDALRAVARQSRASWAR